MILNPPNVNKKNWINALFSFTLIFLWIIFLYQDAFFGMVSIWIRSETFTHGFLVIPITLWLIWRKRAELMTKQPVANIWWLIPIFCISLIWLLGDLVSVNSVTQLAATAIVILLVVAVFGQAVASVIVFPLAFLFFSVPLGEFLLPLLMEWTAKFTVIAVRLSGVPVYQEGLQFIISSGSWSVVEACSGVRYLISSVMIGTLYAYLNFQTLKRRVIFIGFSIIVPVLANWVRAYIIVMLGHFSGNTLAVGFDHLIYGWLFFGIVIMLMFLIGGHWSENGLVNFPVVHEKLRFNPSKNASFWYVSLVISIFSAFPVAWVTFVANKHTPEALSLFIPDSFKSGWISAADQPINIRPTFDKAVTYVDKYYVKNSNHVGLYIKYYRNQNSENKLVSSVISATETKNNGFVKVANNNDVAQIFINDFTVKATDWHNLGVTGRTDEILLKVWQFYWVDGLFTANDYKAKIYGAFQRLQGKGDDSAVIVLYANNVDNDSAKKVMTEFLQDNILEIKSFLEKTRDE